MNVAGWYRRVARSARDLRDLPPRPAREHGHHQVVTARDDPRASREHLGHGDTQGKCPAEVVRLGGEQPRFVGETGSG